MCCAGAQVMSLLNKDENKTFGAVFRTPVENSKGIPHILEHSVLCGSKKYPIKEPFVELMKGSLNTFLNAFTYPDRTCYPVASTNLQVRNHFCLCYQKGCLFILAGNSCLCTVDNLCTVKLGSNHPVDTKWCICRASSKCFEAQPYCRCIAITTYCSNIERSSWIIIQIVYIQQDRD